MNEEFVEFKFSFNAVKIIIFLIKVFNNTYNFFFFKVGTYIFRNSHH